jgi:hypothetical protein
MLMALLTGSWWAACRTRVSPGSVAVDFRTDPEDNLNRSDNDSNAVAEGEDADEDAESVEDCNNEDTGRDDAGTEDNSDGFG